MVATKAGRGDTLRSVLRRALEGGLPGSSWLYLRSREPTLDAPCLLVDGEEVDDPEAAASAGGFPVEGLDGPTLEDVAAGARQLRDPPGDELLLEAFRWYWRHDAFLPAPGAPPPRPRAG